MIKFHPSPEQLTAFAEGTLSPVESLMVSAHCDMCSRCETRVADEVERAALEFDEPATSSHTEDQIYKSMFASITQVPADEATYLSPKAAPSAIELDGRKFELPRTLRRYASSMGNWSGLVGRLWQAPVDLGEAGVAHFIYMGRGGSVPEHTHRGCEYTLVLSGEFCDGLNTYDSGDFIYMNGEHTHAPHSDDTEGCLVFSIVDQPLHFTSGIARLLNPFSHLFFR
ncbi:ChrR family anti-sigma-E factor [Alteromonas halophila]|uniref:Transcriptional regulator n=1 Tax=Alteromonas halophila TaxID=516698 RepID=A0A918JK27_9ALTE|nr:ChrR family anti-sigma-E factor [Alteromonas halophila]GGW85675.1 transcriptional regulator [Alteromonas halophila]